MVPKRIRHPNDCCPPPRAAHRRAAGPAAYLEDGTLDVFEIDSEPGLKPPIDPLPSEGTRESGCLRVSCILQKSGSGGPLTKGPRPPSERPRAGCWCAPFSLLPRPLALAFHSTQPRGGERPGVLRTGRRSIPGPRLHPQVHIIPRLMMWCALVRRGRVADGQ